MNPRMKWLVIALAVGAVLFAIGFVIATQTEAGIPFSWWWVIPVAAFVVIAYFGLRVGTQAKTDDESPSKPRPDEHPPAL